MEKVTRLGTLDGRLCGQLARDLAKIVAERLPDEPGEKGRGVKFTDMGAYSAAERVLVAIGVMAEPSVESGGRIRRPVFTMDADDMPAFLAARIQVGDARVEQLLVSFLEVACHHHGLETHRDRFSPPHILQESIRFLMLSGYVAQAATEYRWTDKIAPAMRAAYFWDDENEGLVTKWLQEEADECKLVWESMPDTWRHKVKSGELGVLALAVVLARSWEDGHWRESTADDRITFAGHVGKAQFILDQLEQGIWK